MQKKSFITVIVVMVCFSMFLSGCDAAKNVDNANSADVASPTPTTSTTGSTTLTPNTKPNNEMQTAGSTSPAPTTIPNSVKQTPDTTSPAQTTPPMSSTPTTTSKVDEQTPDSTSTNQADSTEIANTTGINTGLPDGTKVKLFVSGQEIHWAIIIGDEVLVPDYPYIFGQLKDAGGIEWSGFLTMSSFNNADNKEYVEIYNSLYTIEIVEGEYSFTCNDVTLPLTVPIQTIDGYFHIPIVALAEAINATVEWDADAQAIKFYYE